MAKNDKDKGPGLDGSDILIAVLTALAGSILVFVVVLLGGAFLAPNLFGGTTADQPAPTASRYVVPAQSPRPDRATAAPTNRPDTPTETQDMVPTQEPPAVQTQAPATQTQAPVQTQAPTQTQAPAPSRRPAATNPPAVQPSVNVNPVVPTIAPTQPPAGNQGGNSGGNSATYSRDNWPKGVYLGSVLSDKYHWHNCRAAATILPENEIWFSSESEAQAANYFRCGICW